MSDLWDAPVLWNKNAVMNTATNVMMIAYAHKEICVCLVFLRSSGQKGGGGAKRGVRKRGFGKKGRRQLNDDHPSFVVHLRNSFINSIFQSGRGSKSSHGYVAPNKTHTFQQRPRKKQDKTKKKGTAFFGVPP